MHYILGYVIINNCEKEVLMNQEKFKNAIIKAAQYDLNSKVIGTLSEKTLHRVVKFYLEENDKFHEIKMGPYFLDIFKDDQIIEIQTKQFNKLIPKVKALINNYQVRIVFPTFHLKTINWINCDTNEVVSKRLSPKQGNIYQIIPELYRIKSLLSEENLKFSILLIDFDEYRFLNGWSKDKKRGSVCYDRIPKLLWDEINIEENRDYRKFLPFGLNDEFTSSDLSAVSKINMRTSQLTLNILNSIGIIYRIKKNGKQYVYKIKE